MSRRLACALFLFSLTACDQIPGLSKDAKEESTSSAASAKPSAGKSGKAADGEEGTIAAPKPGEEPTLRVGAWARYAITSAAGKGTGTWAIVEKRGDDEYLMDADVNFTQMPVQVQAWLVVKDLNDPKSHGVKDLKARINNGAVQSFQKGAGGAMGMMVDKLLDQFFANWTPPKWEGLPQEDVDVPAGRFEGCYKWDSEATFAGMKTKSTIWTHPKVPLPAMAKMVSKDSTWELVAYGEEGAKKSF